VWIMARTSTISQQDYLNLVARVDSLGYDLDELQKATHK
jgi:apolipoprotein D and lipocalin family protein